VCCSTFGFCGTSEDFYAKASGADEDILEDNDSLVGALTHLFLSFGYITPDGFNIAPMDGLNASYLADLTSIKSKNPDLKNVIALGSWAFNNNNTVT
jgi:hypothetical protein